MLMRRQIQGIAQRNSIGLHAQERDYVQHLILFLLYSRSQELIFKDGTALRIAYSGNRYSEELDFNGPEEIDRLRATWEEISSNLKAFGVANSIRNEWLSDVSYSFDVSFQGPLFDGRNRTKGKVRVDVNRRQESVTVQRNLANPDYDDLRPFVVTTISQEHMLAEKVRALLIREKPRDVYDIWFLARQGVQLDVEILSGKLAMHDLEFSRMRFENSLRKVQVNWEQDLRPLLSQLINWEQIVEDLEGFH